MIVRRFLRCDWMSIGLLQRICGVMGQPKQAETRTTMKQKRIVDIFCWCIKDGQPFGGTHQSFWPAPAHIAQLMIPTSRRLNNLLCRTKVIAIFDSSGTNSKRVYIPIEQNCPVMVSSNRSFIKCRLTLFPNAVHRDISVSMHSTTETRMRLFNQFNYQTPILFTKTYFWNEKRSVKIFEMVFCLSRALLMALKIYTHFVGWKKTDKAVFVFVLAVGRTSHTAKEKTNERKT